MDHTRHQLNPSFSGQDERPLELRGKIQQTRDEIGKTVNTIQEQLSPERIKEQIKAAAWEGMESVKDNARVKADQWRVQMTERISNNPIPAAMVGVGLVWLFTIAAGSTREREYGRRYRGFYSLDPYEDWPVYSPEEESGRIPPHQFRSREQREARSTNAPASGQPIGEQVSQWADQAQEYLGEWKSRAQHQTDEIRDRAREQGERAKGEFHRLLQTNPLAMGAMTLAIGMAIGLSLPRSRKEDHWFGETRDHLVDQAKAKAQEIMPKVKQIAGEMPQIVREPVREPARTP
jgi:ElaB/YqjD/DUF883 family membrane-anchored ribosome-binding protein